jgi:hypothetical protein
MTACPVMTRRRGAGCSRAPLPGRPGRGAGAECAAGGAGIPGGGPAAARAAAGRIGDRTPGTLPVVQMATQLGTVAARLGLPAALA